MKDALMQIKEAALEAIKDQDDLEKINELRVKYLGKKGELTAILKGMGKLSSKQREIILQTVVGDLSLREYSEQTEISYTAAFTLRKRALRILKKYL